MEKINILLLGSGGREHALLVKLAESPKAGKLFVAPGNGGMLKLAEKADVNMDIPDEVAGWAKDHDIDLVVVGPEAPLVEGVADAVRAAGIACFGPNAKAAQMEGSKEFAKQVMDRAGVPTAAYQSFTDRVACEAYVKKLGGPCVIKADGLAAGKGVIVAGSVEEALDGVRQCFGGAFGAAGNTVIVEELLSGPECSLLALTDGETVVPLATSQDHKRAYDGDEGPNTGGMGVYSPVPEFLVSEEDCKAMVEVMNKVVRQLKYEGNTYSGCLYGGFMITEEGPKVLEFNARFGDPETQVVLPRMKADLVDVFMSIEQGKLNNASVDWIDGCAVSVVLASQGYPGSYNTGKVITGLDAAEALDGITIYHAGTRLSETGAVLTAGGRVLDVTAVAPTFEEARERAYEAVDLITFEGKQYRTDIGSKAMH